jgi:hypothetical protein
MNTITLYLIQLIVTLAACLLLAAYIRPVLKRVLLDLCVTEERAQFWTLFSNIMLVILPVIFGMGFKPEAIGFENSFFEVASQLRTNLLGFILSLVAVGFAVSFFALFAPRPRAAEQTK